MAPRAGAAAALAAALCLPGSPAALGDGGSGGLRAQEEAEVRFSPRATSPEEKRLVRFLLRSSYRVWTRDTVIGPDARVNEDVLVLGASVRLAGRVDGSVAVVVGDLFLRPGARVGGDVLNVGGGLYRSSRAGVDGDVVDRPNTSVRVVREDGSYVILRERRRGSPVDLHGLYGFEVPTYQRTDGGTFGWGLTVEGHGVPGRPALDGSVRFHSEGDEQWEGTVRNVWRPARPLRVGVTAERATLSNERWIRGDFGNTLSYFTAGNDLRNYYRAERVSLDLEGEVGSGRQSWGPFLSLAWEESRSLTALPLPVLFEDDADFRANPAIDEGKIWSLTGGLVYRRFTGASDLRAEARLEGADAGVAGDFTFLRGETRVSWEGPGAAGHRIELFGIGRGDLSGALPRQRWSALGGHSMGLPTLPNLSLRGERLLFGRITYLVPVPPLKMPLLDVPSLFVRNGAGTAWNEGEPFSLEDDVTLGVRVAFGELGVALSATGPELDPELVVIGRLPADLP